MKFFPEFKFFLEEGNLQSLNGSCPCVAHLGLLLQLTHSYSLQSLAILNYTKIRSEKPQITRKKAKETVKNQGITQSFNKKFLIKERNFI